MGLLGPWLGKQFGWQPETVENLQDTFAAISGMYRGQNPGYIKEQLKQQRETNKYNKRQQELLDYHYQTDRLKLDQKRKSNLSEAQGAAKFFKTVFPNADFQVEDTGEDWELVPVSTQSDMVQVSEKPIKPGIDFGAIDPRASGFLGLSPEDMQGISMIGQADPKTGMKMIQEAYKQKIRGMGKSTEPKVSAEMQNFQAWKNMSPAERAEYKNYKDFTKSNGVNVSISNVMPGEAAEKAGQKEGYEIGEQAAMIENKYSAVDSVREAREMLKQGIYSGYWGDMGKTIAKASMGAIGDRQKAARTEQFMSYIGNTVVPRLKEFGGNDSNEEMKYLQKIMGGDTSMEPEAISAILESAERKIQRGIERLQRQRGALEQGRMPDLGPGPSRGQKPKPTAQPAQQGVKRYNPATGRIE